MLRAFLGRGEAVCTAQYIAHHDRVLVDLLGERVQTDIRRVVAEGLLEPRGQLGIGVGVGV